MMDATRKQEFNKEASSGWRMPADMVEEAIDNAVKCIPNHMDMFDEYLTVLGCATEYINRNTKNLIVMDSEECRKLLFILNHYIADLTKPREDEYDPRRMELSASFSLLTLAIVQHKEWSEDLYESSNSEFFSEEMRSMWKKTTDGMKSISASMGAAVSKLIGGGGEKDKNNSSDNISKDSRAVAAPKEGFQAEVLEEEDFHPHPVFNDLSTKPPLEVQREKEAVMKDVASCAASLHHVPLAERPVDDIPHPTSTQSVFKTGVNRIADAFDFAQAKGIETQIQANKVEEKIAMNAESTRQETAKALRETGASMQESAESTSAGITAFGETLKQKSVELKDRAVGAWNDSMESVQRDKEHEKHLQAERKDEMAKTTNEFLEGLNVMGGGNKAAPGSDAPMHGEPGITGKAGKWDRQGWDDAVQHSLGNTTQAEAQAIVPPHPSADRPAVLEQSTNDFLTDLQQREARASSAAAQLPGHHSDAQHHIAPPAPVCAYPIASGASAAAYPTAAATTGGVNPEWDESGSDWRDRDHEAADPTWRDRTLDNLNEMGAKAQATAEKSEAAITQKGKEWDTEVREAGRHVGATMGKPFDNMKSTFTGSETTTTMPQTAEPTSFAAGKSSGKFHGA